MLTLRLDDSDTEFGLEGELAGEPQLLCHHFDLTNQ